MEFTRSDMANMTGTTVYGIENLFPLNDIWIIKISLVFNARVKCIDIDGLIVYLKFRGQYQFLNHNLGMGNS